MTVYPTAKNKIGKCNACLGNAVRNCGSKSITVAPYIVCTICQGKGCIVTANVLCFVVGDGVKRRRRDDCCDVASRVDVFLSVFGRNVDRSLCNGNSDLYFANVVVACFVGSEDRRKGVHTCIAYCGGCGCTFNAPCTLYTCRKGDDICKQITVGCGVLKAFKCFGVCNRSNFVCKLLSCTCAICPNVVVAYKRYYCCVCTNVDTAKVNDCVLYAINKTRGLLCSVVFLIGNSGNVDSKLSNYKCNCFALASIEVFVACKDCLNVVCTCVNKRFNLVGAFCIGEILEGDLTVAALCKDLIEACTGSICASVIRPALNGGCGNGNVCFFNGYVNISCCCKIVCTLCYAVSDNVFACADDCINNLAILGNNRSNSCTVGSGYAGNYKFIAVIILGVCIVRSIDCNSCFCNCKVAGSFGSIIVSGAFNSCSYNVRTCINGNNCAPCYAVFRVINNVCNVIAEALINGNNRHICGLTVCPAVDCNRKCHTGGNDFILESNGIRLTDVPLIVNTVYQSKNSAKLAGFLCNVAYNII